MLRLVLLVVQTEYYLLHMSHLLSQLVLLNLSTRKFRWAWLEDVVKLFNAKQVSCRRLMLCRVRLELGLGWG